MDERFLFVDLDDSLMRWDVSFLSLFLALRRYPSWFFKAPYWFFAKGRGYLKEKCAIAVLDQLDPAVFPLRDEVLLEIKKQRAKKNKVILLSASQDKIIQKVRSFLPMIDQAYGSSLDKQYKGKNKLKLIEEITEGNSFSYVGDAAVDLKIWSSALCKSCFLVSVKSSLLRAVKSLNKPYIQFKDPSLSVKEFWLLTAKTEFLKNSLFILCFFFIEGWKKKNFSFLVIDFYFLLCLLSFSAQILSDLFYIQEKARAPSKKDLLNPIVSGLISMSSALKMSFLSLTVGLLASLLLHPLFFLILLCKFFIDLRRHKPELSLLFSFVLNAFSFFFVFASAFLWSLFL